MSLITRTRLELLHTHSEIPHSAKSAFIDQQADPLRVTQKFIGFNCHMIHNIVGFLCTSSQKLLKISRFRIWNDFLHPIHVFPRNRLASNRRHIVGPCVGHVVTVETKMVTKAHHKNYTKRPPTPASLA